MPVDTHPAQDTEKLDSRVSALLEQMQQASDRVLKELDGADAAAAGPPSGDGLGTAVDQMLGQARSAVLDPPPAPPAAPPRVEPEDVAGEIESLDQHLAGTGDAMIEGEIADEAAVLAEAAAASPSVAPALPLPAPPLPAPAMPTAPQGSLNAASAAPAAAPATKPAEPARAKPTPAAKPDVPATPRVGIVARVWRPAWAAVGPKLIDAGEAVSSFVPANPPVYRRLMGYLALVGVFNAACLLGYNFVIREPAPPAPAAAPAEHGADADAGHGAAKDSHGAEPKKDDHGASGHGDAKKKTTAKKPRTRSTLPKDKKGGGHGGGH